MTLLMLPAVFNTNFEQNPLLVLLLMVMFSLLKVEIFDPNSQVVEILGLIFALTIFGKSAVIGTFF